MGLIKAQQSYKRE